VGRLNFRTERLVYLAIAAMSIVVIVLSVSYNLGSIRKPGPGLYPFAVGLLILPLDLLVFISSLKRPQEDRSLDKRGIVTVLSFVCACVFWIVAMPYAGYPIVTFISTFILSKVMKLEGWVKPLILSVGVAIFIYLLFDYWLYIDLPRGILE
jgi:putative tricarboxylic transport membrane protein